MRKHSVQLKERPDVFIAYFIAEVILGSFCMIYAWILEWNQRHRVRVRIRQQTVCRIDTRAFSIQYCPTRVSLYRCWKSSFCLHQSCRSSLWAFLHHDHYCWQQIPSNFWRMKDLRSRFGNIQNEQCAQTLSGHHWWKNRMTKKTSRHKQKGVCECQSSETCGHSWWLMLYFSFPNVSCYEDARNPRKHSLEPEEHQSATREKNICEYNASALRFFELLQFQVWRPQIGKNVFSGSKFWKSKTMARQRRLVWYACQYHLM